MFVTRSRQSTDILDLATRSYRPSRRARVRRLPSREIAALRVAVAARWNAIALDRRLAAGIDPDTSPLLAARASQLTSRRGRRRAARGLAGAFEAAQNPKPRLTAALPPQAAELIDAQMVVHALTRRLNNPGPVGVRGVAMLAGLLTDLASPLYQSSEPGLLGSHLRAAAAALESSTRFSIDSTDRCTIDDRTLTPH